MSKAHPAAELFPLLEGDGFEALYQSISTHGYDPRKAILRYRGAILDGRNRLRACEMLGLTPSFRDLPDDADPYVEAWKQNGARRDLEPSQKAMIYLRILAASEAWKAELERKRELTNEARAAATRSQVATQPRTEQGRIAPRPGPPSREASPGKPKAAKPRERREVAADIAKAAGVSRATVERAQAVQRDAPEKADDVAAGKATASEVQKLVKLERKHALADELRAAPLPAAKGPFRVIVCDPPWQYEARADDITHRGRNPYPDMSTEEICALPVATLAEPDALLWLWTTNAFMRDAFRCLDAWGFREKTILTWCKDRMGTGGWLRGKTEHCILAVRGKPLVMLTNQTTELRAGLREHSRKPDEFFALVDALCPGTKLEMFAREARAGWAAWGAETEKFA